MIDSDEDNHTTITVPRAGVPTFLNRLHQNDLGLLKNIETWALPLGDPNSVK